MATRIQASEEQFELLEDSLESFEAMWNVRVKADCNKYANIQAWEQLSCIVGLSVPDVKR